MLHNQFKAEDQTVDLSPEDESVHYLSNGHKTAYMVIKFKYYVTMPLIISGSLHHCIWGNSTTYHNSPLYLEQ